MLDSKTRSILRYIKKHPDVSLGKLVEKYGEYAVKAVQHLVEEECVDEHISHRVGIPELELYTYQISPEGNAQLEDRAENTLKTALDSIKPF